MKILFEDDSIIVVYKEAGEATQTSAVAGKDLVSAIKVHLAKSSQKKGDPYVGVIHRLDQPVSGILVFAKNPRVAADLSKQVSSDEMTKIYTAKVEGVIEGNNAEVRLTDYMYKDSKQNKAVIVQRDDGKDCMGNKVQKAELFYTVKEVKEAENISILQIRLITGRFHQIRAQLSNIGHPIVGDRKYGSQSASQSGNNGIALSADRLMFAHPVSKEKMDFRHE